MAIIRYSFFVNRNSNITMRVLFLCALMLLLYSCKKDNQALPELPDPVGFTKYIIFNKQTDTTENNFVQVDTAALDFTVQFDRSAEYTTTDPYNQYDINKLYGFSDNGAAHHQYSARFGWRWSDGALRLFAYVYNNSQVVSEEIGIVPIGTPIRCRIAVADNQYHFYCNEWIKTIPRASTTPKGKGYLLYPYFGGDETA